MGATLPRHIAHSKAKMQGARRRRALCPRCETIDTFLRYLAAEFFVAFLLRVPAPVGVREHDIDARLVDEIGCFLDALEPAAHRRGGEAQELCQLSDSACGLARLVEDQRAHVGAEAGRLRAIVWSELVCGHGASQRPAIGVPAGGPACTPLASTMRTRGQARRVFSDCQ